MKTDTELYTRLVNLIIDFTEYLTNQINDARDPITENALRRVARHYLNTVAKPLEKDLDLNVSDMEAVMERKNAK